jgi:hypothetical protein
MAASASRAYNQYLKELPRCLISERNVILTNNVAAQLKLNEISRGGAGTKDK